MRVRLLSGQNLLTLIHAEIQGSGEADLPARMFGYHIRLREKHPQHPLVSLAVLTHRHHSPRIRSQTYTYEHWGCSLTFTFPVVNLESWRSRIAELLELAPVNPFAVVVLAQLEANANHPDALRLVRKEALVRRLYDWGFSRHQIVSLFNILDAMLVLSESMEAHFVDAVSKIEEERQMTYVNTIERVALRRERQEGLKEGLQKGVAEVLTALVTQKFGPLPDWAQARMAEADEATLNRWTLKILDAKRIEDVFV